MVILTVVFTFNLSVYFSGKSENTTPQPNNEKYTRNNTNVNVEKPKNTTIKDKSNRQIIKNTSIPTIIKYIVIILP